MTFFESHPNLKPPKGILFLAHGCNNQHTYFYPPVPDVCPECIGLPEEVAIVRVAVEEFQLVVAAFSMPGFCWKKKDGQKAAVGLKELAEFYDKTSPRPLPVLALGASVGGEFVCKNFVPAMEAVDRPLSGIVAAISKPDPADPRAKHNDKYPLPIAVYITMVSDRPSRRKTTRIVDSLKEAHHAVEHIPLHPIPITDTFFHERIPGISKQQSFNMSQALLKNGKLDPETRLMTFKPTGDDVPHWTHLLTPYYPALDITGIMEDRQSPVWEVLSVAYGYHKLAREGVREGFEFIFQQLEAQSRVSGFFPSKTSVIA